MGEGNLLDEMAGDEVIFERDNKLGYERINGGGKFIRWNGGRWSYIWDKLRWMNWRTMEANMKTRCSEKGEMIIYNLTHSTCFQKTLSIVFIIKSLSRCPQCFGFAVFLPFFTSSCPSGIHERNSRRAHLLYSKISTIKIRWIKIAGLNFISENRHTTRWNLVSPANPLDCYWPGFEFGVFKDVFSDTVRCDWAWAVKTQKNLFFEKYESFVIDDFLATTVKSTFEGEHHSSIISVNSTVICRRRITFHCLLLDILAWQSAL